MGTYKYKRNKEGKFTSLKRRIVNGFKFIVRWITISGVVGGTIYLAFLIGQWSTPFTVQADITDTMAQKVDKMQDEIVNDIANLENKTNIPGVYDDNKGKTLPVKDKISYGCLQFKISTVQYYENNLNQRKLSDNEAVSLAIDCTRAKELAKQIIFEVPGGLFNWSVATNKMASQVELIKTLIK